MPATFLAVAGPTPASARDYDIRLGYFPNITHAQALYARATGFFETNDTLHIQWHSFNAGPTAIEAIFSDAIDATFVGPGPTVNGFVRSSGKKFVVISGAASGGAALVVRKDSGIQTERDFAGKTLATPQLGNTQDVAARLWLQSHNYKLKERGGNVSLVPLSNADQLTMFKKKQVDAAWTIEPWVARLELEGNGSVLVDEKTLWPDGKYVTTQLIVTHDFLQNNPQAVRKLLRGLIEITQAINTNKTAAIPLLNAQIKKETSKSLKDEVIRKAIDRVEFTWDPIASSLHKGADAAFQIHFLRKKPELDSLYSLKLLNEELAAKKLPEVKAP